MMPMPTSLLEEDEVEFLVGVGDEDGDISFGTMEGTPVPDFPQRPKSRAAVGGDKENYAPSSGR